jgi:hypothetical protein
MELGAFGVTEIIIYNIFVLLGLIIYISVDYVVLSALLSRNWY